MIAPSTRRSIFVTLPAGGNPGRRLEMSAPRQQPGVSVALAGGDQVEPGERGGQLPGCGAKRSRRGPDLAERGDRKQPARGQALDHRLIEAAIAEFVAQDD